VVVLIIVSFLSRLVATTLDSLLGIAFGGRSLSNDMHMLDFRTLLFELLRLSLGPTSDSIVFVV